MECVPSDSSRGSPGGGLLNEFFLWLPSLEWVELVTWRLRLVLGEEVVSGSPSWAVDFSSRLILALQSGVICTEGFCGS